MLIFRFFFAVRYNDSMNKFAKVSILGIVVVAVAMFVIYWNIPSHVYQREISQLHAAVVANNEARTSAIIARTSASGEWGVLERAVKDYVKDRFDSIDTLLEYRDDDTILDALNPDVLRDNAPDLTGQLNYLNEAKDRIVKAKEQFKRIATIDDAVESVKDKLNDEMLKIYKNDIGGDFSDDETRDNVLDTFDTLLAAVEATIAKLEILKANPNAWDASGNELIFSDPAVQKQYDAVLGEIVKA